MDISLLIECEFTNDDIDFGTGSEEADTELLEEFVHGRVLIQRLAGGTITDVESVTFEEIEEDSAERAKQTRRILFRMLPGSALIDRSSLVASHHQRKLSEDPNVEYLDSWLDFVSLERRAIPEPDTTVAPSENHKAEWQYQPKPASGWLVPIAVGYKAISRLYAKGEVARSRDQETPFRFVELAYGLGQWISPHRTKSIDELIWRYQVDDDWYLCRNVNKRV